MSELKIGDKVREKSTGDIGIISHRPTWADSDDIEKYWYVEWVTGRSTGYTRYLKEDYLELVEEIEDHTPLQQSAQDCNNTVSSTGKISSNGGSSDYYKLDINGSSVQVEDIIYAMVGGDFALGNAVKALRRMYLDSIGGGKQGVDMTYDANKIKYFVDSFVKRFGEQG